jgi:transposase-like protein
VLDVQLALVLLAPMGDTGAMIHSQSLIDDTKCFETVRALRWSDGVHCPACESSEITNQGRDDTPPERQRYLCQSCSRRFDDLTDTIFAGHHQPLRVWIVCLYLMGLNLSNAQIAKELALHPSDVHQMTCQLRQGLVAKKPSPTLSNEVECDEVYVVAGHKGKPDEVAKKGVAVGAAGSGARADGAPSKPRNRRSSA